MTPEVTPEMVEAADEHGWYDLSNRCKCGELPVDMTWHILTAALAAAPADAPTQCDCPPCPGRGNDGHGLTHCAECCFGTGVEADPACPVHGDPNLAAAPETRVEWGVRFWDGHVRSLGLLGERMARSMAADDEDSRIVQRNVSAVSDWVEVADDE